MKLRETGVLLACVALMSACVIEPPRGGGPGGGRYEGGHGGRHEGGGGYGRGDDHGGGRGGGYARGDHWRGDGYEVQDWRGPGLQEPPHGYHWVRAGDQFVLAAIATGIISAIVLAH